MGWEVDGIHEVDGMMTEEVSRVQPRWGRWPVRALNSFFSPTVICTYGAAFIPFSSSFFSSDGPAQLCKVQQRQQHPEH